MNRYAIIVLAAGASSRLGQPKQLLSYGKENLLNHAINQALSVCENVIVVLGSGAATIAPEINSSLVHVVLNNDWQKGMASSIRCGISYSEKNINPGAVILTVADQPYISTDILKNIFQKYETGKKPIVASSYKKTLGVPVLFDSRFFNDLKELEGQSGAKKIIANNLNLADFVDFPMGHIDIDTPEDYDRLKNLPLRN